MLAHEQAIAHLATVAGVGECLDQRVEVDFVALDLPFVEPVLVAQRLERAKSREWHRGQHVGVRGYEVARGAGLLCLVERHERCRQAVDVAAPLVGPELGDEVVECSAGHVGVGPGTFGADGVGAERLQAAIAVTGKRHPERFGTELEEAIDFFDLKGILESWLERRRLAAPAWQPLTAPAFKPGAAAVWEYQGKPVIMFGEVAPELVKGFRLRAPLFIALIELEDIIAMTSPPLKYETLPQFPSTTRDISFVAPAELTHQKVLDVITGLNLPFLEKISLFDIFSDEKILGKNRCSRAYSITFRNAEKTITDDEANALQEKIRAAIGAIAGVELR
ncbi:MAG TPA: hypothetical protein PLE92_02025, partial [Lentisphaeria bacterium]|nr:hypothetical protein [Lentisphaeria bacterium]